MKNKSVITYLWLVVFIPLFLIGCKKDEPENDSLKSEIIGTWYGTFKYTNPVSGVKYNRLSITFDMNQRGSMEYESSVSYRNAQFSYSVKGTKISCVGVVASTDDDEVSDFNLVLRIEGNRLYPENMYSNYILTKDGSIITDSNGNIVN